MNSANKGIWDRVDILVIGGGTAGSVAAIKAKEALPDGKVLLLEKANVKRSGAIALGMDGVNNAVVPGHATPEQYVKEITMANDGIVNQRAVLAYARESFGMIQELESWGVKFQKTPSGDYDVKKVHHKGSYVLPMPEGYDIKKILTRVMRQTGVEVENRVMATRILLDEGRAVGAAGFNVRTGAFVVIRAKAVILACGACGRLGLPASGYLMGTYENPSNAGDGYAMAYHAGAELTNIECFQVNPLLKDYNGPSCAYVSGPFGGYTVNAKGNRFMLSDYWSGQMMWEFYRELHSANGPVYLKMDHLAPETVNEIEQILHTTERPSRGRFHAGRGVSYGSDLIEMSISEIGLCSGHSASGVWINERGETTVPGLYAAGDMASVPHGYMLGAFTYGKICGRNAVESIGSLMDSRLDDGQIKAEQIRVLRPLSQHIFLTLVESLEGGERLPTKILVTYLQHPEDSVRRLAIELLEYGNDPAAIPALLRAAADVNIEVSLSASEVLRSFRNPSAVKHLIEGLKHPAPETRLAAVVALRERRAPDAVKGLLRNISDVESEVRREAVIALAHYRNHDLLPALRSALRDESPAVRRVTVAAVAEFDGALVFDDLVVALSDDNWQVRREAAIALGSFPGQAAGAALRDTLGDSAWQVVREAALSLSRLQAGDDERLAGLLLHEVADLRMAAAVALGESRNPAWIARLQPLLNDPDTGVQKSARRAIARLAPVKPQTVHS